MKNPIQTISFAICICFFFNTLYAHKEPIISNLSPNLISAIADAGQDQTLTCVENEVMIGGDSTSMGSEFSYEWTSPSGFIISTEPNTVVSETGEFILTVSNSVTSFVNMDTVLVLLDQEIPEINATSSSNLTCVNNSVFLNAVLVNDTIDASYLWIGPNGAILSPNTNESVEVNQGGDYEVVVTNLTNGCSATSSVAVFEDFEEPIVVIVPAQILTCDDQEVVLESDTNAPNSTFQWIGPNGNTISSSSITTVSEPGIYTIIITNSNNGCNGIDEVEVLSNQVVTTTINADAITTSEPTVELNADDFVANGPNLTYLWTNQAGIPISSTPGIIVIESGTYTCMVTDQENGCVTTILNIPVEFVLTLVADAGPDLTLNCTIATVNLFGQGTSSGPGISYVWTNQVGMTLGNSPSLSVSQAGEYTLTVTDNNTNEQAVDIAIVNEDIVMPNLSISPTPTLTCFAPTGTLVATSSNVQFSEANFMWSTNSGTILTDPNQPSIVVSEAGDYTVVLTNNTNGCTIISSATVDSNQENQTVVVPTLTSTNPALTIDPSEFMGDPNCSFGWEMQSGLVVNNFPFAEISQAGTYTFVKTDNQTGCNTEYIYTVQFATNDTTADAGPDQVLNCFTSAVSLGSSNTSVGAGFTYSWSDDQGNLVGSTPIIAVSIGGNYTLTVFNTQNNTFDSDMVTVFEDMETPDVDVDFQDFISCQNSIVQVQGITTTPNVSYLWSTFTGNIISSTSAPSISVDEPGSYSLLLTNLVNGCTVEQSFEVEENIEGGSFDIQPIQSSVYPVTLTADDFPSGIDFDFIWEEAPGLSQTGTFTAEISQPGQYTFVATSQASGCDYSYVYTVYNNILADAGPSQSLTCEINAVTLGGPNTSTGASLTYLWLDENNTQLSTDVEFQADQIGTYTLVVEDEVTGEVISDVVLVDGDFEEPEFIILEPSILTFEQPSTLLFANLFSPDIMDASFNWNSPSGTVINNPTEKDIRVDVAGEYVLDVTNTQNGCISSSSVSVLQDFNSTTIPLENIASSTFPIELDPSDIIADNDGLIHQPYLAERSLMFEYKWIEREGLQVLNFPIAQISQPGVYAFLSRDIQTGFVTRYEYNISLQVSSSPIADAGPGQVITCAENQTFTLGGANTSCGPDFSYAWTDGAGVVFSTEKEVVVSEPGSYTLTVTNNDTGEQDSAMVAFQDGRDLATIEDIQVQDMLTCMTSDVLIDLTTDEPVSELRIEWTSASGTGILSDPAEEDITVNEAGEYTVSVTKLENECTITNTVFVEQIDLPLLVLGIPPSPCNSGGDVIVDISAIGGVPPYTFSSSNSDVVNGVPLPPGIYDVTVTDNIGCSMESEFEIIEQIPLSIEFVINDLGQLEAIVSGGVGNITYTWNVNADSNIIDNPINGFEYFLVIMDEVGCTFSDSFLFVLDGVFQTRATELRTYPNPTSDYLYIELEDIGSQLKTLSIFDKLGREIQYSKIDLASDLIRLDVSNIETGTYFIQATISERLYFQKLIVF